MAVHVSVCMHPPFFCLHKRIHNSVHRSQLPNLLLHRFFKYTLLLLDQTPLLFVVLDALMVPPASTPPVAPRKFAGCAAIGTGVAAFFTESGAFGACSERAAPVSNYGD